MGKVAREVKDYWWGGGVGLEKREVSQKVLQQMLVGKAGKSWESVRVPSGLRKVI
jgi:hypothetical protein